MLVEDFLEFRKFIRSKLEERSDLLIISEVADGLKAVEEATAMQPDLILLDVGLPSLSGIEVARRLRKLTPKSKIIFLSQQTSEDLMEEAIALGALGYVFKSNAGLDLLPAIDAAVSGRKYVSNDPRRNDFVDGDGSKRL